MQFFVNHTCVSAKLKEFSLAKVRRCVIHNCRCCKDLFQGDVACFIDFQNGFCLALTSTNLHDLPVLLVVTEAFGDCVCCVLAPVLEYWLLLNHGDALVVKNVTFFEMARDRLLPNVWEVAAIIPVKICFSAIQCRLPWCSYQKVIFTWWQKDWQDVDFANVVHYLVYVNQGRFFVRNAFSNKFFCVCFSNALPLFLHMPYCLSHEKVDFSFSVCWILVHISKLKVLQSGIFS